MVKLFEKTSRYIIKNQVDTSSAAAATTRRHISKEFRHLATQMIKEKLMTNTIYTIPNICTSKKIRISYSNTKKKQYQKEDGKKIDKKSHGS